MNIRSLFNKILGRPLASSEDAKQELTVLTGFPALGLDSLASTAYGPEAALAILLPLGVAGLQYFFPISIAVVIVFFLLYLSYMQTFGAYPQGSGAYAVTSANFGKRVGIWAAVALLLDYLLNVAVGISAGIGAVVSAIPALQPHTLLLCLVVLIMLTIVNLRGIRETGIIFLVPVFAFIFFISCTIVIGLMSSHVHSAAAIPHTIATHNLWIIMAAFANGLTAMTGIEAVSNAVPIFRQPNVRNARWTLTLSAGSLALFLLGIGYLAPGFHIMAMDETRPGYQTVLSQLVIATTGKGIFYYFAISSIFIVLTYSAQTSFADFPRVCRLLAEDNFLPSFFAERGRRLVFSHGIVLLAIFSAILLIAFRGVTIKLIPLFAVGAFSAFLFSQSSMVMHWLRKKDEPRKFIKLLCNMLGALATFIGLVIIIVAKFIAGAWIIIVVAPLLVFLLTRINRHYKKITQQIKTPLKLKPQKLYPPIAIIPIHGWDRLSERAVEFGLLLSDNIICVYISSEKDTEEHWLRKIWAEKVEKPSQKVNLPVPKLEIINAPYRRINKPILDFVKKIRKENPRRLIAVIIPELVEAHWYEHILHNIHAASLRTSLFLERDSKITVITIPWYLREKNN